MKFTDRGEITVLGHLNGDFAEFSIADRGIGIADENLQRIFEPFWQVQQSATRRAGGTGLGLSVSRSLARLLGGEISAASNLGEGSTFTLTPPTHRADLAKPLALRAGGKGLSCGVALLGQQPGRESLTLGDSLHLERDRVYRLVDLGKLLRDLSRNLSGAAALPIHSPGERPCQRQTDDDRRHHEEESGMSTACGGIISGGGIPMTVCSPLGPRMVKTRGSAGGTGGTGIAASSAPCAEAATAARTCSLI